jgi:hypothetical protein
MFPLKTDFGLKRATFSMMKKVHVYNFLSNQNFVLIIKLRCLQILSYATLIKLNNINISLGTPRNVSNIE